MKTENDPTVPQLIIYNNPGDPCLNNTGSPGSNRAGSYYHIALLTCMQAEEGHEISRKEKRYGHHPLKETTKKKRDSK